MSRIFHVLTAAALTFALFFAWPPAEVMAQQPGGDESVAEFYRIIDAIYKAKGQADFAPLHERVAGFRQKFPASARPIAALAILKSTVAKYNASSNYDEALALARESIRIDKAAAEGYMVAAIVLADRKEGAASSTMADQALALAPGRPEVMAAKAEAERASLRFESAASWFQKSANAHTDPVRKSNLNFGIFRALSDDERIPADRRKDIARMESALRTSTSLNPAADFAAIEYGCFQLQYKGDVAGVRQALANRSRPPSTEGQCLATADYLDWARRVMRGEKAESADKVAARTGLATHDVLAGAAMWPPLNPILSALLKTKAVSNINALGSVRRLEAGICCTPVVNAAYGDNLPGLKLLVAAGANVQAEGAAGRTPLMYAIYSADPAMVAYLLKQGARVNARDKDGNSPLYYSMLVAQRNRVEMTRLLIGSKGDLMAMTSQGQPLAIWVVAMTGQESGLTADLLKLMVNEGRLDVNAADKDGVPLIAVAVYDTEQVRFLLSKGARPIGQVYGGDFVDFYETQKPVPPAVATSLALIRDARKKTASR